MPRDPRITRWSFYNYIFAIEPEAFAGAGNEVVAYALEREGVPAEVQYPPMSRYDLFQPSLSRPPVAVEHADRLDPSKMSFPVAEDAGLRRSVYRRPRSTPTSSWPWGLSPRPQPLTAPEASPLTM
jgi:hypothetical protein